jgi:hypothetical protein
MRTHLGLLIDLLGENLGPRDFRKHVGWYLTGFPLGGATRRALASIDSMAEFETLVAPLDPALPFPEVAHRAARGHTHGPRRVTVPTGWFDAVDDPTPPVGADVLVSGG